MATYTAAMNLYLPNRNDTIAVDQSLANNFQKIEDEVGGAYSGYGSLNERLQSIIDLIGSSKPLDALLWDGIEGDGVNDDTLGIQQMLDQGTSGQGITIYFPEGVYRLTDKLYIYEGTRILAHQNAYFEKDHDTTLMANIKQSSTATGYYGERRIAIIGGRWDCNAPTHVGGTPFAFAHCDGLYLKDMVILDVNPGHAFEINSSKRVYVDGCSFYGMENVAGKEYSEAIQLDLMKSNGAFPWKDTTFDHTPCENVTITNCVFGKSGKNGAWGRGIGSHSATIGKPHKNIIIKGNVFEDTLHWGVRCYNWNHVIIAENIFLNCSGGLSIDPPDTGDLKDTEDASGTQTNASEDGFNFLIANNIIRGGGGYGSAMSITGEATGILKRVTVIGNQISEYDAGDVGIYIRFVDDIRLMFNHVRDIANTSISTGDLYHLQAIGNTIVGGTSNGITLTGGGNYSQINDNIIEGIGGYGIWVSGDILCVNVNSNNIRNATQTGIRLTSGLHTFTCNSNIISGTYTDAIWCSSSVYDGVVNGNMCGDQEINIDGTNIVQSGNLAVLI